MKTAAAPISTLTPPPTAVPAGSQPHHAPPAASSPFEVDDDTAPLVSPPVNLVPMTDHPLPKEWKPTTLYEESHYRKTLTLEEVMDRLEKNQARRPGAAAAIPPLAPDLVPDLIHPAAMTRDALAKVEAKLAKVQQDLDAASAEQGRLIRARRVLSDTLSAFRAVIAQ